MLVVFADDASSYPRRPVQNSAALQINGGGAYLTNNASAYYMGRMTDGQIFRVVSTSGFDRWGYSESHNRCMWIGPQGGGPDVEYLGASIGDGTAAQCSSQLRTNLGNRTYIGKDFNCADGRATGGSRTRLIASTPFYYKLDWAADYQSLSVGGNLPAGTIPAGWIVSYRFTTKDNQWAAVEIMNGDGPNTISYGWGFIQRSSLQLPPGGTFNYYNNPTGPNRVCDRLDSTTPGTVIPDPDTYVTSPAGNGQEYFGSTVTFSFNSYSAGLFTGWNLPVQVNAAIEKTECKIDDGAWHTCTSPYTTGPLTEGSHTFQARTFDTLYRIDPAPSVRTFVIKPAAHFADVTGDGKADAIAVDREGAPGIAVRRSNGSSFGGDEAWTSASFRGTRGTKFADVTGDGRADAIAVKEDGVYVRESDGNSFVTSSTENWTGGGYYGSRNTEFADVTGDGKADAIVVNDTAVTVRRSTGTSFSSNESWTTNPYYGDKGTYFADATGDGKADAIVVNAGLGVTVRPSNGSSFSANQTWLATPAHGTVTTAFGDADGDGRADVLTSDSGSPTGLGVRRAGASSYGSREIWFSSAYWGNKGTYFADVTGDGRVDAIAVNSGTGADGIHVRAATPGYFGGEENWGSASPGDIKTALEDINSDGRADLVTINSSGPGIVSRIASTSSFAAPTTMRSNPFSGSIATIVKDLTNDRRAEIIAVNPSGITYLKTQGSNQFEENVRTWVQYPFYGNISTHMADVTGDEQSDAVALNASGVSVVRAQGDRGADSATQWANGPTAGSISTFFADVNGDRKADLVSVNASSVEVRLSSGTSFAAPATWLSETMDTAANYYMADVSGDARADLVVSGGTSSTTVVYRGSSAGFSAPNVWLNTSLSAAQLTLFGRVDTDGRADAVSIGDSGSPGIFVRRAFSDAFLVTPPWSTGSFFGVS